MIEVTLAGAVAKAVAVAVNMSTPA